MFDRSDANKDGTVTKTELAAVAAKEQENDRQHKRPGRLRPSWRRLWTSRWRTPGRHDGHARPGDILPPFLQRRLRCAAAQKTQIEDLQKEVTAKLDKILTDDQRQQLKEMRQAGRLRPSPEADLQAADLPAAASDLQAADLPAADLRPAMSRPIVLSDGETSVP